MRVQILYFFSIMYVFEPNLALWCIVTSQSIVGKVGIAVFKVNVTVQAYFLSGCLSIPDLLNFLPQNFGDCFITNNNNNIITMIFIACWLECQTRDKKIAGLIPDRSGGRIFFSRVNFVC